MKKYKVTEITKIVSRNVVEVEAENEGEAQELACIEFGSMGEGKEDELPEIIWEVEEIEKEILKKEGD